MRMTALDVQNHTFPRRFSGYDVDEVEQFRASLVEDWAELTAEADGLRRRVAELEARIREISSQEDTLRDALVTAQGLSDDLRRTAEQEAQMRVGAAEIQAEKILAAAHRQTSRLAHDVRELRALRTRVASSVRATIETHLALLEGFSQDYDEEADARPTPIAALAAPSPEAAVKELEAAPVETAADAEDAPAPIAAAEAAAPAPAADEAETAADEAETAADEAETAADEAALAAETEEAIAVASLFEEIENETELFGPPGPPQGEEAPEVQAASPDAAGEAATPTPEPARAAASEPAKARPKRRARPEAPSGQGWRVFFGQG